MDASTVIVASIGRYVTRSLTIGDPSFRVSSSSISEGAPQQRQQQHPHVTAAIAPAMTM